MEGGEGGAHIKGDGLLAAPAEEASGVPRLLHRRHISAQAEGAAAARARALRRQEVKKAGERSSSCPGGGGWARRRGERARRRGGGGLALEGHGEGVVSGELRLLRLPLEVGGKGGGRGREG